MAGLGPFASASAQEQPTPPKKAPAAKKNEPAPADAIKRFGEGIAAFEAKDYPTALAAFEGSYAIVPSPNSKLMAVRTLEAMGREDEAYERSLGLVKEADLAAKGDAKYRTTADSARLLRDHLRKRVALIRVRIPADVPAGAELTMNGKAIPRARWKKRVAVLPGAIAVRLEGYPTQQVKATAGGKHTIDIREPRPTPPAPPSPAVAPVVVKPSPGIKPWTPPPRKNPHPVLLHGGVVTGVLGVAGLGMFAGFGVASLNTSDELEALCPGDVCGPGYQALADEGHAQVTAAYTGLAIGAAGVVASAVMLGLHFSGDDDAAPKASVVVAPNGVQIVGAF